MRWMLPFALALSAFGANRPDATPIEKLNEAIRQDDLVVMKQLLASGMDANARDARGATPLMHAAAVGSLDAINMLLAAGADIKAKNAFEATALIWGAAEPRRAAILINAGADVNARTKQGRTPLIVAASTAGSAQTLRLLLAKGADPKVLDGMGNSALLAATFAGDLESASLMIDQGLGVNEANKFGMTPMVGAMMSRNLRLVKLLMAKGANVNTRVKFADKVRHGMIALSDLTPLMMAVSHGPVSMVKMLLDAGAEVNVRDIRGMTPLMLAAASGQQNPEIIRMLLDKGADRSVQSKEKETALDWAMKGGNPEVVKMLGGVPRERSAENHASRAKTSQMDARAAVERTIGLLQNSNTEFFRQSGCVGCHHQNLAVPAIATAKAKGIPIDEQAAAETSKAVRTQWAGAQEILLQRIDTPGSPDTVLFSLFQMQFEPQRPDATTDAMAFSVAGQQRLDGSWSMGGFSRPPMGDGDIQRTALGIRALRLYGPAGRRQEFQDRVDRATKWLLRTKAKTTIDQAMKLAGLRWAGASHDTLMRHAEPLLRAQQSDGGWAQNPYLDSDALATGYAIYALRISGMITEKSDSNRKAAEFLTSTQRPDGSWHVRARSPKFQPYFESGFPYGHDQWVSASATAWAAMALAVQ